MACLRRRIDDFLAAIHDPGPELPLDKRLHEAIGGYLGFVESYPRRYRAVLRGGIGADTEAHDLVEKARERFADMIFAGLGMTDPPPDFALAVWAWMGFVEATCTRWLDRQEVSRECLHDVLVETGLSTFSRGLGAEPTS